MNIELLKQYADIKNQIKSLEDQESFLKTAILEELDKNKMDKAETAFGKFTKATKITYIYSPKVNEMEEKVKLAKLKEVEKGIAEEKKTEYLLFKS